MVLRRFSADNMKQTEMAEESWCRRPCSGRRKHRSSSCPTVPDPMLLNSCPAVVLTLLNGCSSIRASVQTLATRFGPLLSERQARIGPTGPTCGQFWPTLFRSRSTFADGQLTHAIGQDRPCPVESGQRWRTTTQTRQELADPPGARLEPFVSNVRSSPCLPVITSGARFDQLFCNFLVTCISAIVGISGAAGMQ